MALYKNNCEHEHRIRLLCLFLRRKQKYMATFYPSIETIIKLKVPPTEGERTLLDFLGRMLDDSYEVYFNPYLNGDRPDVLIMREGNGVLVIEVKDWNLDNFTLNEKKKWIY